MRAGGAEDDDEQGPAFGDCTDATTGPDSIVLSLEKALANSTTALVVGVSAAYAPFKGGTRVPVPDVLRIGLPVDGNGRLVLQGTWPAGVPTGTPILFQHWVTDPGGPFGYAASNGVGGTTP